MLRFKNANHLPATPKHWKHQQTGHRIEWDSTRILFSDFLNQIMSYCEANGVAKPTAAEVEDSMCRQMSSWACTDDPNYHLPPSQKLNHTPPPRTGGCGACGGKR